MNLSSLNLSHNAGLEDLTPLAVLTQMSILDVSYASVHSIEALAGHSALTSVTIAHNHVTDLGALAYLLKLTNLDASYNDITSIADLAGLQITWLNLSHNEISNLGSLVDVTYLPWSNGRSWGNASLDLSHNNISDLTDLANSSSLSKNVNVDITANPIDCTAQAANISKLRQLTGWLYTDCL